MDSPPGSSERDLRARRGFHREKTTSCQNFRLYIIRVYIKMAYYCHYFFSISNEGEFSLVQQ
ncbi:hypothetical protein LINGRAHAP2_LOCUS30649, partial [Linum grandiflorum]